jgi:hypothetical protein
MGWGCHPLFDEIIEGFIFLLCGFQLEVFQDFLHKVNPRDIFV